MQYRRIFGKNVHHFQLLDSTNLEAWRMVRQGQGMEGTIIRADYQARGRGQGNTQWESQAGMNLCVSAILEPTFLPPDKQFLLNKALSLAVRDTVARLLPGIAVSVKWPNDIYAGTEKIAGMLIENAIQGSKLGHSIAGIGINVNQLHFAPLLPNPVSVARITGRMANLDHCLEFLLLALEHWYGILRSGNTEVLDQSYLDSLLGFGEKRQFLSNGQRFYATITGISRHGKLLLQMENGRQDEFDLKEVEFLYGS
jgi:BirA family biotin operon repressor/biotin-[acetyl-CoA-carboxylase] ligase